MRQSVYSDPAKEVRGIHFTFFPAKLIMDGKLLGFELKLKVKPGPCLSSSSDDLAYA
ncbi:putative rhamnogalacturonate lyase C, partial [Clarias magur]